MLKGPNFSWALPPEPPPQLHHEPVGELTAPRDPHLHFTAFKKLNLS